MAVGKALGCGSMWVALAGALVAASAGSAAAATLGYSGRLLNASGGAVSDGGYDVVFRIWKVEAGGIEGLTPATSDLLFTESFEGVDAVSVTAGYFAVTLAQNQLPVDFPEDVVALFASVSRDTPLFLELEVEGEVLAPRSRVHASPWVLGLPAIDCGAGNVLQGIAGDGSPICVAEGGGPSGASGPPGPSGPAGPSGSTPADSGFSLLYFMAGTPHYLWSGSNPGTGTQVPALGAYSYNPTDTINPFTFTRNGVGDYTVAIPGVTATNSTGAFVSAWGSTATTCKIASWGSSVRVLCFQ